MLLIDRWSIACRRAESHTGLGPTFTPRITAIIYRGAPSGSSRRTSTPSTTALEGWKVGRFFFPTFQLSTGYFRQLHRRSQTHRQFPGDSFMTQQIRPIRRHVNDDLLVGHGNRVEKRCARRSVGLELENARLVDAQAKLFCGAEHPVRFDAADFAPLELETARQRRTDGREGIGFPGLHVRRTADHFERRPASGVDEAKCEPVGVGMLAHLEHARDEDVAQVLMDWHYTVDGSNLPGQSVSDVLTLEWPTEQRL